MSCLQDNPLDDIVARLSRLFWCYPVPQPGPLPNSFTLPAIEQSDRTLKSDVTELSIWKD
jgi:hypothetical protein